MTISREDLAAFADGELDAARAAEVAAAVLADPALRADLDAHRALKAQLGAHFAPIHDTPVPDRLTDLLRPQAEIIDFATARDRRIPRWSWMVGPALAASLALVVFLPRDAGNGYVEGALAETLDSQLVASQAADAPTRVLLSFRNDAGAYCRAFANEAQSGIACRDDEGWRLAMEAGGVEPQIGEFRMAGTPAEAVLKRAQALAAGPALDASEESAARSRGWR